MHEAYQSQVEIPPTTKAIVAVAFGIKNTYQSLMKQKFKDRRSIIGKPITTELVSKKQQSLSMEIERKIDQKETMELNQWSKELSIKSKDMPN